jgi:hypothetical protein
MIGYFVWLWEKIISNMRPEWITAIATFLYAIFTGLIIWEMRRDRRSLHQPILVVQLKEADAKYPVSLVFTLKNIGKGPALKCETFCEGDKGIKWKLVEDIPPIGVNETQDMKFEPVKIYPPDFDNYIWLEVKYLDIFKKKHKVSISVDQQTLLSLGILHASR